MSSYKLRKIVEGDLEMLREHRNQLATRCWLGDPSVIGIQEQRAWWENPRRDEGAYQIVTLGDRDIGLIRLTFENTCVGADIFERFRGQGHGRHVFDLACREARSRGQRSLWLKVFIENTPAVRVYLEAGFVFAPDNQVEECWRELPGTSGQEVRVHYAIMTKEMPR